MRLRGVMDAKCVIADGLRVKSSKHFGYGRKVGIFRIMAGKVVIPFLLPLK
jgi:hypothetical protein